MSGNQENVLSCGGLDELDEFLGIIFTTRLHNLLAKEYIMHGRNMHDISRNFLMHNWTKKYIARQYEKPTK